MWRVIEQRLSSRWPWVAAAYAGSWLVTGAAAWLDWPFRSMEGLALLAGAVALILVWFLQSAAVNIDGRERREALHYALPVPYSSLDAARIVEPLVLPSCVTMITVLVAWGGRLGAGGEPRHAELWLLGGILGIVVLSEQAQICVEELRRLFSMKYLIIALIFLIFALMLSLIGLVLGSWVKVPETGSINVFALFGRWEFAFGCLVATGLMAELNRRLLALRRQWVD